VSKKPGKGGGNSPRWAQAQPKKKNIKSVRIQIEALIRKTCEIMY